MSAAEAQAKCEQLTVINTLPENKAKEHLRSLFSSDMLTVAKKHVWFLKLCHDLFIGHSMQVKVEFQQIRH